MIQKPLNDPVKLQVPPVYSLNTPMVAPKELFDGIAAAALCPAPEHCTWAGFRI